MADAVHLDVHGPNIANIVHATREHLMSPKDGMLFAHDLQVDGGHDRAADSRYTHFCMLLCEGGG